MIKLGAEELRITPPGPGELEKIKRNPIIFVLDEILDTFNIGSMFRLADALAVEKIYLCGAMETPPSSRIHKAAVGTENWVPWEKVDQVEQVVQVLKNEGVYTIAIEQDRRSTDYRLLTTHLAGGQADKIKFPVALILGHETKGVSAEVLGEVDKIVELPMFGVNKSFNVWGSAAVVGYKLIEVLDQE